MFDKEYASVLHMIVTAWKVPVFGFILVHIFPHSDWIRRDTEYSVQKWKNTDQNNSEDTFYAGCCM